MFTVASVSASDVNETVITSNDVQDDEIAVSNEEDVMTATTQTMTDLKNTIDNSQNTTIVLKNDYSYYQGDSLTDGIMIDKSVTIDGQNHKIDGQNNMRLFRITNGASVTFKNIIFLNGFADREGSGGAVWNNGAKSVTAINCTFENNRAYHGGALDHVDAKNCTFINNNAKSNLNSEGGAMYDGIAVNCTFIKNYSDHSGGATSQTETINCTFINNTARVGGGAMYGRVSSYSTFINNRAFSGGAMKVTIATRCTFINNIQEGYTDTEANIFGTVINCTFINDKVFATTVGFCLERNQIEPIDMIKFIGLPPQCNLKITATKDGKTQTFYYDSEGWKIHDLEPGIYKVTIDILNYRVTGHYETEINVTSGSMSMAHLNNLIKNTQNKTITLDYDYYCTDMDDNLANGIIIDKSVTIDGQGHKLDGNYKMRIFQVTKGANVTFKNITFLNAATTGTGGAIWNNEANVTVINCTFENNAAGYGGALFKVNAENCTFKNNNAYNANYGGGAMYEGSATYCTFIGNVAFGHGGAMNNAIVANSTFINNIANNDGGAVFNSEVANCNFINNNAKNGGAMSWGSAKNCTFTNNNANNDGGAMSWGIAENCTFTNNNANNDGGAVYEGDVSNSTFNNNIASNAGGAMSNGRTENCTFTNNTAKSGGAISEGSATNCTFIDNKANDGGAINEAGALNCTFINNTAYGSYIEFYTLTKKITLGQIVPFYCLPECNLTITATNKDGASKTFTCTDKGWEVKDLEPGIYNVTFTVYSDFNGGEFQTQITIVHNTMKDLDDLIQSTLNDTIILNYDYFWGDQDQNLTNGIIINESITIDGQGHKIDVSKKMRMFQITNNATVTFKNITFLNGWTGANGYGGAVWNNGAKSVTAINCTFENNTAHNGGALTGVNAINCTFKNNYITQNGGKGGAMYEGTATNCIFTGNGAINKNNKDIDGGAMYNTTAINCTFTNNNAIRAGGAMDHGTATNCTFIDNTAQFGQSMASGTANNCTFINNDVRNSKIQFYITNNELKPGDTVSFTGLPESSLTVNVTNKDGESKTFDCTNEGWTVENLEPGTSTIKFIIKNDKGNTGESVTQITVPDALGLNVNVEDVFEGENAIVNITANPNFTGDVSLSLNGINFNVKVNKGKGTYQFADLEVGNYTVTVSFKGNDEFNASTKETTFKVKPKYDLNLTVNVDDINEGNMATITVTTNNTFNGDVKVSINGKQDKLEIIEGKGEYVAMELNAGSYTATVSFDGNKKFNATSKTAKFEVKPTPQKTDLNLKVTVGDIYVGETAFIRISTNNTFNGKLIIVINGIANENTTIIDGIGIYNLDNLTAGNYTAYLGFNGDDTFDSTAKAAQFEVKSIDQAIEINAPEYDDTPEISIELPTDATGNLTVNVDGTNYTKALVNGSASITVPTLSEGEHNLTVTYSGDDKYSPVTKTTTINIKKAPVIKLTKNTDIKMLYTAKTPYKVLVTKDGKAVGAGESVKISFNGVTYTVKTDKNGYATFKIPDVKPQKATYTITATYKGITVKNTVKVNSIIKAKNKKVKKSKKVTKVKITLKKVNGKYLKSKTLKIKFKGKTYKAKTNKKGTAKWKVKKSMLKKLKVGKKYKYKVTYGKDKVTKKLKIKK
ncbi:Ig-like domain repeat protein [Methanobrevibacter sp.]|uniref:Ig-like domain repeat protein n=1 Tax=Methanobrevibacter sp. TaxID=66852 RepID=UPI0025D0EFFD|nr:Ig-like domain repeat protein [Methanobrevibacter sp.]